MKISRLNWLSWSNMLIVSGNVCCTSWQYPWKSFRVHIHKAEIYSILSPYNSVSSLFCQCAVRVFSLQEVPLWSYEKSVWAGAQMNSPEWQTAADQHGPHWDVRGNLLETIISAIFHFNKVLTRSLFFCRHCPPLTSESPWQIFHRAVENVNELFAPSNGSKWRMVRMRDQVHIEVHLWTQTAIGRIGIHMTWPILDSYFILWDKGVSRMEEVMMKDFQRCTREDKDVCPYWSGISCSRSSGTSLISVDTWCETSVGECCTALQVE